MSIPVNLAAWAVRHGVSPAALADLARELGTAQPDPPPALPAAGSEGYVQSALRLAAASDPSGILWRNNKGVLEDKNGRPVRFGLANDSKALSDEVKSADLIGIRKRTVTPAMVGSVIGQFLSLECKVSGWTYRGDKHETAQARWAQIVTLAGGEARFVTHAEQLNG